MLKIYDKLRGARKYILFFCDFVIWNASYFLSFFIEKKSIFTGENQSTFLMSLLILNVCFTFIFTVFKLHNKIWRYANLEDFFYAALAALSANFLFCIVILFLGISLGVKVFLFQAFFSVSIMILCRFIYRLDKILQRRQTGGKPQQRLLLVGGGEAAVLMLNEFARTAYNTYLPICIVDDDREKLGRTICGLKIVGTTYEIPDVCEKYNIDTILFSIAAIEMAERKRILDICAKTNLKVKIVPNLYKLVATDDGITSKIRPVEVEDLLGRDPIIFDNEQYGEYIKDKVILVTGGGGSIGSELCRQIAKLKPKNLIILDIYENNAYEIQQELKRKYKDSLNFEVEIASIRDREKMERIFSTKGIDVVFHAAAHKHVPLMETNPEEAVKNNIFGTMNVAFFADKYKVKKFVQISTDKAVNPTNVMGATKRVCEMIVQRMDQISETSFVAVRFGNVLGSNGSVIPLFKEQLKQGGPLTVTHPDIIRYFMTIPEAVSLVLTAGSLATGGEIFVLDMGNPVKIKDLAESLIRLSGLIPYKDIDIKFTGLRPGEKLYEELLMSEEGMRKTENDKIYIGKPIEFDVEKFTRLLDELKIYSEKNDKENIERELKQLVPTFNHEKNINHE